MPAMKNPTFADQIRRLIETSGQTRYRIGVETGIEHATLSRFMSGKTGISLHNLNVLAAYLDWKVISNRQSKSVTKKKGRSDG